MSSSTFSVGHLMHEMMQHESLGVPAEIAMRTLCSNIQLHSFSADRKVFMFSLQSKKGSGGGHQGPFLTLQVVKGSLHTLMWSTFARFDDEYALFFHLKDPNIPSSTNMSYLIWSIQGVDAVNSKISAGMIDWFMLRKIQSMLKITSIGLLAFSKLLGRFLISVPNFIKTRKYLPPMPATFMFNYLMVVCHCPFELGVPKLNRLLRMDIDYQTGFSMKRLLQTLIQPNGSGSWLLGYLPVRTATGGYVLQSRYYFEQNIHAASTDHTIPTDRSNDTQKGLQKDLPGNQQKHAENTTTETTHNTPTLPTPPTTIASDYSLHCTRLMMETAVRVVELLPHPLGRNEVVVVIEFVHNNSWSANTRFVSLDAFLVGQAILLAGQPPPPFLSRIDVLDCQGWYQRVQHYHSTSRTSNSTSSTTNNQSTTLHTNPNNFTTNNPPLTPNQPRHHHNHHNQQQHQQQHLSPLPTPNTHTRTATLPVGMDTSGSGNISGLNSMFGSPMLDSFGLGMNLSAFSSPQPQGMLNTSSSGISGMFSPITGASVAQTATTIRGVPPTVSMDSYDNYYQPAINTANDNYNNGDDDSRLHSAADIILQAATKDRNSSTNTAEHMVCDTHHDKDTASVSHSNNGYSTYDEKEPLPHQPINPYNAYTTRQSSKLLDSNDSDCNSDNSSSIRDENSSTNDSDKSGDSSDEHNSTDLFIENIHPPTTVHTSPKKKHKTPAHNTNMAKNKKKATKRSKQANPKSRSYYTNPDTNHTNTDTSYPYNNPTSHPTHTHTVYGSKNRSYTDTIDFANSCEWGTPSLMKKDRNFYSDLLKELLPVQSPPTVGTNVGYNNAPNLNG